MTPAFGLVLLLLIALGVPVVFALLAGPIFGFFFDGKEIFLQTLPRRLYAGMDSFPLLAIPLFILAGNLMNTGGITVRLVEFAKVLVGHLRGGLAQVNIVSSVLFAGLSGSAVADTSALGSMLVPAMERDGYTKKFAVAVTAASSIIGPIIPPSIIMIVYAYVMNVSVAALFAAGIVPGLIMAVGLMAVTSFLGKRRGFPKNERRATVKETGIAFRNAFVPLMTPVIILGGIVSGVFTPTEAAGSAVVYALFVGFFYTRSLKLSDLPRILTSTGVTSASILIVVGAAAAFGYAMTLSQLPARVAEFLPQITTNLILILFLVNLLLLATGMFLDSGPAIIILAPLLGPALIDLGVDPLHLAAIMSINLSIGLATPPLGLVLFVGSSISDVPVATIAREMTPYYMVHFAAILAVTFIPALSLTVPRLLGLI
ncbi:TRAP transporter large permease [Hoeflea prorocentri]|uniref:TRAP transporter large permease protein n=1 Tax=Hoeflea prorocentri TaxID=1922333 RepID=A0A9X3ZGI8_9HYPH|nr:TRAP transporter large permease [Hoeflea prorocentri]MCY6379948.1 TRAP transporter large permease [Hoeflea prorocentri]MDA5397748.1 TRAP transporter large permease [Hoeflea prorocentri]